MTRDQGPTHPLDEKAKAEIAANRTRRLDAARVRLLELPSHPDAPLSYGAVFRRSAPLTARFQRILGYVDSEELSEAADSEGNTCLMNPMESENLSSDTVLGIEISILDKYPQIFIDLATFNASVTTTMNPGVPLGSTWYCDGNTEIAMSAAELVVDAMISPFEEALNLPPLTNALESPEMQEQARLFDLVDSSPTRA